MSERLMSGEPDLPTRALEALHQGSRNEAVRLLQREWHIGPAEARDVLDRYQESHAAPRRDDPGNMIIEKRTGMRLLWVIVLATAATAAFFYFQ